MVGGNEHLQGYFFKGDEVLSSIYFSSCFLFFRSASRRASCFSLKERLFLVRTLRLYLIIMKFLFFCFSLLEELANGLILVFFFTNSFLSVFPAFAVANLVSLSDLGFLCRCSISLSESNSPLDTNSVICHHTKLHLARKTRCPLHPLSLTHLRPQS